MADLIGNRQPTHSTYPEYAASTGPEIAELMQLAGTTLDPWQQDILTIGLGEKPDGTWSAFEVAIIVARQNGKNVIFEARELGGLFLLDEKLIIHTAHQYKTAQEAYRRTIDTITNCDYMRKRVKRIIRTNGEEGIELINGNRLRFLARSKASGRGFSGNCVILDEAYELGDDEMSALLPTMSAQPNPQLWYGSSAGMPTSIQLGRLWRRIMKAVRTGELDPSLAGFVWQAEVCSVMCRPGCTEHDRIDDPRVWAKTNPALGLLHANGTKLTEEFIRYELASFGVDGDGFARERLSVGDYPPDGDATWEVISEDRWTSLEDEKSSATGRVSFAVEVGPERRMAAISMAGVRPDGHFHVEVVEHQAGTEWVPARMAELYRKWRPIGVVVDPGSHAGSLIEPLRDARVPVNNDQPFSSRDTADACALFYDSAQQDKLRHLGQAELTTAVAGALTRPLSDAWAWDRKHASVDISPLVSCTFALWAMQKYAKPRFAPYDLEKSLA